MLSKEIIINYSSNVIISYTLNTEVFQAEKAFGIID